MVRYSKIESGHFDQFRFVASAQAVAGTFAVVADAEAAVVDVVAVFVVAFVTAVVVPNVAVAESAEFGFDSAVVHLYFAHASVNSVVLESIVNWTDFVPSFGLTVQFSLGLTSAASVPSIVVALKV